MATSTIRDLTALGVAKLLSARKAGRFRVSRHLYLQCKESGAGSWLFRYADRQTGRNRWVGLGRAKLFTLSEARLRAAKLERQIADGVDPLEAKRAGKRQEVEGKREQELAAISFRKVATQFMQQHRAGWSAVHHNQWYSSLHTYAYPHLDMPIASVDTQAVLNVLRPIWNDKTETASRLRGRLEMVLSFARAAGYRDGENPAAWRGHLDHMLPAPRKVHKVTHFAALPYEQVPALMAQLAERHEPAARALEFTILTAARTGETIGAQWAEVDLDRKVWSVPGSRMKAGRAHVVPLSDAAIEALGEPSDELADAVFCHVLNSGRHRPLGLNGMWLLLKELRRGYTVHGMRSAFRDWAAETTSYPSETIEMCLAHTVGNSVENAYRRSNLLQKRAALMNGWAAFCMSAMRPEAIDHAAVTCVIIGDHIGPLETLQ
jgi:integrase